MDVAFVSNVVYPFVKGGAQKRIHEIGTRLADRGHNVTIYGRQYWDGPEETTHAGMTLRTAGPARDLYAGDRRSISEAIGFSLSLLGPLGRHVDEHDLVVASVFPYFPVLASKLDAALGGTPLATTWHEVWGDYWQEYLGPLAPCGKLVERLVAAVPQHPIAVSGVTADRLSRIGPSRDRISVVSNGVDVDRIRSIPAAEDGFDVLFAGRLIDDKNVDVLIEAFDRVAPRHDATLGIVGDGPRRAALEERARQLTAGDRITFLGFLEDSDDVIAQMHAARVFASPSVREGFGITFVEAMAADCAVIGAEHPRSAAGEVLGDGGMLTAPNADDLARALTRALEGECPAADPVATARGYDWDLVADRAARVYRSIHHHGTAPSVDRSDRVEPLTDRLDGD